MKKTTAAMVTTKKVMTVTPDWSVDRLLEFLSNNSITGVLVVNKAAEPIGVVSLTDIARNGALTEKTDQVVPAYYGQSLERFVAPEEMARFHVDPESQTTVRDIMTPVIFAVEEDTSVQEVAEMMITGRIHRVFVKHAGKLTGIITSMDLLPLIRDAT